MEKIELKLLFYYLITSLAIYHSDPYSCGKYAEGKIFERAAKSNQIKTKIITNGKT